MCSMCFPLLKVDSVLASVTMALSSARRVRDFIASPKATSEQAVVMVKQANFLSKADLVVGRFCIMFDVEQLLGSMKANLLFFFLWYHFGFKGSKAFWAGWSSCGCSVICPFM